MACTRTPVEVERRRPKTLIRDVVDEEDFGQCLPQDDQVDACHPFRAPVGGVGPDELFEFKSVVSDQQYQSLGEGADGLRKLKGLLEVLQRPLRLAGVTGLPIESLKGQLSRAVTVVRGVDRLEVVLKIRQRHISPTGRKGWPSLWH